MTWRFYLNADCIAVPADDGPLNAWLREQSDVHSVEVRREKLAAPPHEDLTRVSVVYAGPEDAPRLDVPWEKFGYQVGPSPVWWFRHAPETQYTPADAQLVLIVFACLMAGQFTVGIVRMWRNRKREPLPPAADAPGLLAGLGIGVALAAVYWGAYQAALRWGGPTVALAPCWHALPISGVDMNRSNMLVFWQGVEPHPFLLLVLSMATFMYPVASMVFVWGVFRRWALVGWPITGGVLTALVAPVFLLSATAYPLMAVMVLVLVWLGHRARSMMPPLIALIVASSVVVGITFGMIPSLPHPVNQLPGNWTEVVNVGPIDALNLQPNANHLRFFHGGAAESGGFSDDAWHYEWVGDNVIRLVLIRRTDDNAMTTRTWVREDYHVAVTWEELTLTRVRDGGKLMFRRVH
jgi:hypothetical protein